MAELETEESEGSSLDEELDEGALGSELGSEAEGGDQQGRPNLFKRAGGAILSAGMGAMRRIAGGYFERGTASFYGRGDGFAGRTMANGKKMNPEAFTAAHRTLPLGTRVKVKRVSNGAEVIVEITDRGPFTRDPKTRRYNRILDVSPVVADCLGFTSDGYTTVELYRV